MRALRLRPRLRSACGKSPVFSLVSLLLIPKDTTESTVEGMREWAQSPSAVNFFAEAIGEKTNYAERNY